MLARRRLLVVTILALLGTAGPARAQLVVSANESKLTSVDGANVVVPNAKPDTVTVVDLDGPSPRVVGEVRAPASVIGPPQSVAITPDNALALVTAATKLDPADPTQTIPDDVVSVIDLKASPIVVVQTLHVGRGASGIAINRTGTLALVANRIDGTVSALTIQGRTVTVMSKVDLRAPDSGPSSVAFTADGRTAMVTRNNDGKVSLLDVSGTAVSYTGRDVAVGGKPYAIDVSTKGDIAVIGDVTGADDDAVVVLDLTGASPRVASRAVAGATIESVALSADGRYVAATVMNYSNTPASAPNHRDMGLLKIFSVSGTALTPVAQADTGHWCQGAAWKRDNGLVLVQCASDRAIKTFGFDGRALRPSGAIAINGGPAGIRASTR